MPRVLKLILRETPIGREATPWLELQRERFAQVAKEVAQELKGSKLKGADKIRAMNRLMSQKLKG
jgi:hypothetical protein